MIQEGAFLYLEIAPWITIIPGLALSLLVISFAFLGDAIRDILDPHLQQL
jgi:peptide/nickel transport system permease protein